MLNRKQIKAIAESGTRDVIVTYGQVVGVTDVAQTALTLLNMLKMTREALQLTVAEKRKKYIMSRHPGWKGGKRINHNGYVCVRCPCHPRAVNGYVFEHELVMEAILKRYLYPGEVVHHMNGVKIDNRPENLMLFRTDSDHKQYHSFMRMEMEFNA